MHLERRAGRPVRIAAVGPGLQTPARIHERCRLRNFVGAEHPSQDGEDFGFGLGVGLGLDAVALILDDGYEEDAGAGEEVGAVEGLEDGVIAALGGVGVEEELGGGVPEDLGGGELQEDLGVGAHGEGGDTVLFPGREWG